MRVDKPMRLDPSLLALACAMTLATATPCPAADMPASGVSASPSKAGGSGVTDPAAEAKAHAAHHVAVRDDATRRALVDYQLPDVQLVREDGQTVLLRKAMEDPHPVFVDFIYTTCTAICPVTSATFAALQDRLGPDRDRVRMMSISIDPEEDTPKRLAQFRQKYGAGAQWHHYTGSIEASVATQRAFGVYTGDKMGHSPVTLYRAAPGQSWVRIDGFATPDQLLAEVRPALHPR